jgi:phosphomannomutase
MSHFTHQFDPGILREYDIRGIVDKNLHEADLYAIGRAFGTVVVREDGSKVGLCYDGRHSSPRFATQMIKGLLACGLQIEHYGVGPTPLGYYALRERGLDGVVVITGSHNPPEYNGIKLTLASGPVYGDAIQEIARMTAKGDLIDGSGGNVTDINISDAYLNRLVRDYNPHGKPGLKIAWDAGNGAAGAVLKQFTNKIPGTHILLFDKVDGDFPNHHPDPAVEKNLADLKRAVVDNHCDLGIAFDGDADRIGAVDNLGNVIWSDQLVALYAHEIIDRIPEAEILLDVKCSNTAADLVNEWGGHAVIYKTGHSLMKAKMKETGAPLGGELSGHIFFKDGFYGHDDALYCAIRLLNIVQKYGPLSEQAKAFPPVFNTPEIRFDVSEEDKFNFIDDAKHYINSNASGDVSVLDIDGIRVTTPIGWWLLRASNTQNALTGRVEATSEEDLVKLIDMLKLTLDEIGCTYPEPLY